MICLASSISVAPAPGSRPLFLVRALYVFTPSSMALSMSSIMLSVDPRTTIVDTALSSFSAMAINIIFKTNQTCHTSASSSSIVVADNAFFMVLCHLSSQVPYISPRLSSRLHVDIGGSGPSFHPGELLVTF